MKHFLENYIVGKVGSKPANLDAVLDCFTVINYKRNEFILRAGDICRYCNFIAKGCVQVFVCDKEGNEMTRDFIIEDGWVMA